jgi:hypothetical protein
MKLYNTSVSAFKQPDQFWEHYCRAIKNKLLHVLVQLVQQF